MSRIVGRMSSPRRKTYCVSSHIPAGMWEEGGGEVVGGGGGGLGGGHGKGERGRERSCVSGDIFVSDTCVRVYTSISDCVVLCDLVCFKILSCNVVVDSVV